MSKHVWYIDEDEYDEEQLNGLNIRVRSRRVREPRISPPPKRPERETVAAVAEPTGLEAGFTTTYKPARYEEIWLRDSLRWFYDQELITDVLAQVKGGKEATVYRCAAHPKLGTTLAAAKVYRPRMFRNLRNDALYREGRAVLTSDGRPVKKTDHRVMRAIGKKTTFGMQVQHTSWLMYEYTTMECLFKAGAAVPQPFASSDNAILMGYRGDARMAAPTLSEMTLDPDEAPLLFEEVLRNIELMLQLGIIHGDLSAYNILYWEGNITIIDFPQVTDSQTNRHAFAILQRDIRRVCEYFARQGVQGVSATDLTRTLWQRYGAAELGDPAEDATATGPEQPADEIVEGW